MSGLPIIFLVSVMEMLPFQIVLFTHVKGWAYEFSWLILITLFGLRLVAAGISSKLIMLGP